MSLILIGAIVFSIWFSCLFIGMDDGLILEHIGLSMVLYVLPLSCFILFLLKKNKELKNLESRILLIPITILALTYFIYDNMLFRVLNILVIPILIAIIILEVFEEKYDINIKALKKIFHIFVIPFEYIEETFIKLKEYIFSKIEMKEINRKRVERAVKAILITIPIVLIIVLLLSSADDIFGNIFKNFFENLGKILENIITYDGFVKVLVTGITFVYLVSLFYAICKKEKSTENALNKVIIKDNFTIKTILICLNIIYIVFCIIQIKSLFLKNVSINYADYARKGFFQLMLVSVINLVTILIAKKQENGNQLKSNRFINYMCVIMVVLTFIILVSAAYRMYMYESAYGYTTLRLLVYCILFTEGIMLIPTVLFILDKKIYLAKMYFYIVLIIYVCMNLADFNTIITKRNVERYIETGKIDESYILYTLEGTDNTKELLRLLKYEEEKEQNGKTNEELIKKATIDDLVQELKSFHYSFEIIDSEQYEGEKEIRVNYNLYNDDMIKLFKYSIVAKIILIIRPIKKAIHVSSKVINICLNKFPSL